MFWKATQRWERAASPYLIDDDVWHGGGYWHAPVYHGAWYGAGVAAGVAVGAAVGAAAAAPYYPPPAFGYYPYPPCY